jgi:hypothetical protein
MLMLSTLRRFELFDGRGRRARLDDFAVALRDGDYPHMARDNSARLSGKLLEASVEIFDYEPTLLRDQV